ncbi:MAG: (2Fe-2S)-binding protein [Firmicutes bacterium]|nr:(2Fe-2S)-binding protein [Bacillota bacterium]
MLEKKPVYICRCQEVTEEEIKKAIEDGARTIKGIKNRTHATMGLCQGRTCRRLIERMLAHYIDVSELKPGIRPPVRTIKIAEIVEGDGENE